MRIRTIVWLECSIRMNCLVIFFERTKMGCDILNLKSESVEGCAPRLNVAEYGKSSEDAGCWAPKPVFVSVRIVALCLWFIGT